MSTSNETIDLSLVSINSAPDDKSKFASMWPQARIGLEFLRDMLRNPIVKSSITIIIATGDAIAGELN